ncbi:ATP-binding cassette domain-containing protein [uncultured Mediterranea sp.]|uniref:ATP-binding cassette domain-containing protein n=1 Tax=uncultured Mediterranea sp. TaxID=1926662 RepID=UPI0027D9C377|nr:ATP-binding cassette domain-containing protein [uncultured Mediterranea sp.]
MTFQSPDPTTPAPLDFRQQIKIRNLSYAFPDGHLLFRRINWTITPGERVGIRGTNGSGKTTLFNLLLGFLEPTEGEIRIDGQKLTLSNRADWHRIVGYVPQEIFIADETLLYNIAFGLPNPDREKARNVLKEVDLADWLDALPAGLDTPMLETGNRLSGGQKQRIGIARALYKEPRVLLLDEASSALDPHTEQEINRSLLHLCEQHRELTLLIISHHEAPFALCNRILDLDNYRP